MNYIEQINEAGKAVETYMERSSFIKTQHCETILEALHFQKKVIEIMQDRQVDSVEQITFMDETNVCD